MFGRFPVAIAAMGSSLLIAPGAAAGAAPTVDASVQVTATPSSARAHATPVVAVDPRDGNIVAVAEGETRSSRCGIHVSTDGGLTWRDGASPQTPAAPRCVRNTEGPIADLTFGPDRTLYYAFPGWTLDDWHDQIYLGRSTDLGRTFQTVGLGGDVADYEHGYTGSNALPVVRVDPNRPSRVYVAWSANYGLWNLGGQLPGGEAAARTTFKRRPYVAVSDDGGRTFSKPVDMAGDMTESLTQPSLAVGRDGTLYAFFGETQVTDFGTDMKEGHLFVATSDDGGRTFAHRLVHTEPPGIEFTYLNAPSAAVNPRSGDVYVTWEETGQAVPKVLFMASSDKAKTWSSPIKLNSVDPARTWDFQEFNPWMSVAPNGRIDAAWYDWRDDVAYAPAAGDKKAENALQNVYSTSSSDGGRTWSPNIRITDRSIDRRLSDVWQNGVHGPVGLASTDTGAYVAWDDSRNAVGESKAQDIYFTRVRLERSAARPFTGGGASTATKLEWAVVGLAVGLGLCGLALLAAGVLSPRSSGSRPRSPEAVPTGP